MPNDFISALWIAAKIIGIWTVAACIAAPIIGHAFAFASGVKRRWFAAVDDAFEQDQ